MVLDCVDASGLPVDFAMVVDGSCVDFILVLVEPVDAAGFLVDFAVIFGRSRVDFVQGFLTEVDPGLNSLAVVVSSDTMTLLLVVVVDGVVVVLVLLVLVLHSSPSQVGGWNVKYVTENPCLGFSVLPLLSNTTMMRLARVVKVIPLLTVPVNVQRGCPWGLCEGSSGTSLSKTFKESTLVPSPSLSNFNEMIVKLTAIPFKGFISH